MGIPAQTYFCENGHIVVNVQHNYMLTEYPAKCHHCDSHNIRMELNFADPEYPVGKVPIKPIRFEHKIIDANIPIYNVTKLFERKKQIDRNI